MALTQIDDRGLKTPIDLIDNEKIRLGTGNDLELYHDGSNSYISQVTAGQNLFLKGDAVQIRSASNEQIIETAANGAVKLYYNNVKQFETIDGGIRVPDSADIQAGNSGDLLLKHDGSNSWIKNLTGVLVVGTADFQVASVAGDEQMIRAYDDGAVELYHDNSKKLSTGSGGIVVYGSYYTNDNNKIYLGSDNDLQIYFDGSHSNIINTTGNLYINASASDTAIACKPDGAVELYHNGTKKLETVSNGINIPVGAAQDGIRLTASGAHYAALYADVNRTGSGENLLNIRADWDGTSVAQILFKTGADTTNKDDGSIQFRTASAGSLVDSLKITKEGYLELPDSKELRVGNGNDLKIYHDGSNTYLDNATGDVYLRQNGTENSAKFIKNGGVELYYNDAKKIDTTSTGIGLHGLSTGTGNSTLHYNSSSGQVTYDTSSRLVKTDIADSPYGIDIVKQLKPRKYKRTDQENTPVEIGFIADEVQSLIPEIVPIGPKSIYTKDASDTENIPINVEYQKLTVVLTTALQEAITKIETLETKVAALEAA